jgi:CubicO group peptidase (beta-lactamase class C family)
MVKEEKTMDKQTLARPIYVGIVLVLVTLLVAGPSLAAPPQQGPTDPAELEAFLDEVMAKDMEEHHIAGAAVAVVKDGELFFAKGYGYADVENGTPVDPEKTLFKLASQSKSFTWTAVMQLVEQGKLDLNADINTYLDFEIPDTYPEPIRLRDLLAHTSGLEETHFEILAQDEDELVPTGEWLASHLPARVRPPGVAAGYSNHNANLAGYVVARAAGVPYEQYIQENILDPLGMEYSSAQMPMPPELDPYRSVSYTYKDGAFQIFHPDYLAQPAAVPGAGMSSSATDMARFMIAHLQNGRYSDDNIADTRILEEATAQQMHSTLFTPDPRLCGMAHGLIDMSDNGQRTIGHGGGAAFAEFNNTMMLLPDQDLGVFVTYNSVGSDALAMQHLGFMREFFDHYYPPPEAAPIEPPADFAERAERFRGSYRTTQASYSTFFKVIGLFQGATISDPGDGTLLLSVMGIEVSVAEVEPLYFRQVGGDRLGGVDLVFREDDQGRITHMFSGFAPQWSFEKLNWYEAPGFNMVLALGCALVFLSVLIVALIGFVRDRLRGGDREPAPRGARVAWWTVVGISILNLLFLAASIGTVFFGNPVPFYGVSLFYRLALLLALLAAVLTIGALVYTVLAWTGLGDPQRRPYWGIVGRVYYTLVTVAAVAFVWFLHYWNLLGWRF